MQRELGWRDLENREGGREACAAHSQGTVLYLLSMAVAMTTTMAASVTALLSSSPFCSLFIFHSIFHPSFTCFSLPSLLEVYIKKKMAVEFPVLQ